jgi:hypothetical protein
VAEDRIKNDLLDKNMSNETLSVTIRDKDTIVKYFRERLTKLEGGPEGAQKS